MHGSNIGIWEIDMPDGVLRNGQANFTNVWEQLGYPRPASPTDFTAPITLVHPDDVGRLEGEINEYLAGHVAKLEIEHRRDTVTGPTDGCSRAASPCSTRRIDRSG